MRLVCIIGNRMYFELTMIPANRIPPSFNKNVNDSGKFGNRGAKIALNVLGFKHSFIKKKERFLKYFFH